MTFRSTIAFIISIAAVSARAGVDFTPAVSEYSADGIKLQYLTFHDDKRRIEFEPPHGWTFEGSPAELHLRPPKKNFADALVTVTPLEKPQPLDENGAKRIQEQFVATLPPGTQFVKIEQRAENSVLLDGNPSFEIVASYQLMGTKFMRSAIFVNLPGSQLMFRITAPRDDFQALYRDFRTSIFSWHWLAAEDTSAQTGTATTSASGH